MRQDLVDSLLTTLVIMLFVASAIIVFYGWYSFVTHFAETMQWLAASVWRPLLGLAAIVVFMSGAVRWFTR